MNFQTINRGSGAALGFVVGMLVILGAIVFAKLSLVPPPIDAARAEARSKALAEIRATEEKALTQPAMLDAARGIVRLPIETAMTLAAQKWQDPAAARADLNARAEKATAPVKMESFE
jgi:hypothetical protein